MANVENESQNDELAVEYVSLPPKLVDPNIQAFVDIVKHGLDVYSKETMQTPQLASIEASERIEMAKLLAAERRNENMWAAILMISFLIFICVFGSVALAYDKEQTLLEVLKIAGAALAGSGFTFGGVAFIWWRRQRAKQQPKEE